MYKDLKRTCTAVVLPIKPGLLFSDILVAVVLVVCLGSPMPSCVRSARLITFIIKVSLHDVSLINCPDLYLLHLSFSISPKMHVKSLL